MDELNIVFSRGFTAKDRAAEYDHMAGVYHRAWKEYRREEDFTKYLHYKEASELERGVAHGS